MKKLKTNLIKSKNRKTVDKENFVDKTNEYTYSFKNFGTINFFGRDINNDKITLKEADKDQSDLLVENVNCRKQVKSKNSEKKATERRFS